MGFAMTNLISIFAGLKRWLNNTRKWKLPIDSAFYQVRYTSVPVWKPWRDYQR